MVINFCQPLTGEKNEVKKEKKKKRFSLYLRQVAHLAGANLPLPPPPPPPPPEFHQASLTIFWNPLYTPGWRETL